MTKTGRNEPCPCGSGRKYKQCCLKEPKSGKAKRSEAAIAKRLKATPPCPDGATNVLAPARAIDACLDAIQRELVEDEVGTLTKLVDLVLAKLALQPVFTYGDIAQQMATDNRFVIVKNQLCALAGNDPVKLYVDKLGF